MVFYRFPIVFVAWTYLNLAPSYSLNLGATVTVPKPERQTVKVAQVPSADTLIQEGNEAIEQEDYQTALQKFQQALTLRPDDESVQQGFRQAKGYLYDQYMEQGYEATKQRNYQEARQQFQQALALRPGDFYAQQAIRNVGKFDTAETEAEDGGTPVWLLLSLVAIAGVGVGLFLFLKGFNNAEDDDSEDSAEADALKAFGSALSHNKRLEPSQPAQESERDRPEENEPESESLAIQPTTRLPNLDIVGELIKDLHEPEPKRRRKAIWELAQRGDSRAVKPLVAIMTEADSHERSLILTALSQICLRTLKPINQALAISLQDDNAQVRKNAIRDSTKIYDLMLQVRQLLRHAANDPDGEVRETAMWALQQLDVKPKPLDGEQISLQQNSSESTN